LGLDKTLYGISPCPITKMWEIGFDFIVGRGVEVAAFGGAIIGLYDLY